MVLSFNILRYSSRMLAQRECMEQGFSGVHDPFLIKQSDQRLTRSIGSTTSNRVMSEAGAVELESAPHSFLGNQYPRLGEGLEEFSEVVLRRSDPFGDPNGPLKAVRLLSQEGDSFERVYRSPRQHIIAWDYRN
jgi:hypothetical protein